MSCYLIVGLGNPEPAYAGTRHNLGFYIVQRMAKKYEAPPFQRKKKALYTSFQRKDKELFILLPQTYMNLSGEAVKCWLAFLGLSLDRLFVVVDDVQLPWGSLRLREQGSSGGHRGLENITALLHSSTYARLRVGIGRPEKGDLTDFVLQPFTEQESQEMPTLVGKAIEVIEKWLDEGSVSARNYVNEIGKNSGRKQS